MPKVNQLFQTACRRYKRGIIAFVCLYLLLMVLSGNKLLKSVPFVFRNENFNEPCSIPLPDPFDATIMKYHWKPDPLRCDETPPLVYIDETNVLHVNASTLDKYNVQKASDIVCEIRSVNRIGDYSVGYSEAKTVSLPANITSDFSRVTCRVSKADGVIYDNILVGVIKQKPRMPKQQKKDSKQRLNVVLIGLDSVSRSASIRHLTKTRATLKRLGGYDFKGYMKVGQNTAPNIIPLLTGRKLDEREWLWETSSLDDAPFIWNNFSERGYATFYAEDVPHITAFNLRFKGFTREPTHHYMRPYFLAQNTKDNLKYKISAILRSLENRGVGVTKGSVFCHQDKSKHEIILNYLRQFMRQYDDTPTFSFTFMTELSHSFINFLAYGDDYLAAFTDWLKHVGLLDNTVLIHFGDHGPRITDIRNTFVGRIESRMPFLNILIPERLKKAYPEIDKSLKMNTKRLVTVYDIHQTLVDIMNQRFEQPTNQILPDSSIRGMSLLKPIPEGRSCAHAWVPEEFCACYKSISVIPENNTIVNQIAVNIVKHINQIVTKDPSCKKLSLSKVSSAEKISPGLKHAGFTKFSKGFSVFQFTKPEKDRVRYRVSMETVPGHASFDATCEISDTVGFKVIGEVERTNMYGNQSSCTPHYHLKPYCFC